MMEIMLIILTVEDVAYKEFAKPVKILEQGCWNILFTVKISC